MRHARPTPVEHARVCASLGRTSFVALALALIAGCGRDRTPFDPGDIRKASPSLVASPVAIVTDCSVLRVVLPPSGGASATVERTAACEGKVLPAVGAASFKTGIGGGTGSEFKPLTLSLMIENKTDANEYGEPATLLIDLAHLVVQHPIGLQITGNQVAKPVNQDGTAASSDPLPGAPFWTYAGSLDQNDAGPPGVLRAGERSAPREAKLSVLAGVQEFTVPVYTRMRLVTMSGIIGSGGGVLEHPAGASVEIPSGSFGSAVRVTIEEVASSESALPVASGAFQVQVVPQVTQAPSAIAPRAGGVLAAGSALQGIYTVTLTLTQAVQTISDVAVQVNVLREQAYYAVQTTLVQGLNAVRATAYQVGEQIGAKFQAILTQTATCEDEYKLLKVPAPSDPDGDAEGRPVVYIHGIQLQAPVCLLWRASFDPSTQGDSIFRHLNEAGLGQRLQYWRYTYPTFNHIDEAADNLASQLRARFPGRTDIILVAHSMGGLVARAAISRHGAGAQVSHLITLGTPHEGVPLAEPLFYSNTFVGFDLALLAVFDQDAVTNLGLRVLIDRMAKGLVPYLILIQPGALDLRPTSEIVGDLEATRASEPQDRYFTFAGTLGPRDLSPYRCGDGSFSCQFVALGFLANEARGLGPSDGFVPRDSALLDGSQKQTGFGSGYDHFELNTGDFDGAASAFRDPDPLLARVASIIADLSTPHAVFAASGQGSGAPPSDLYLVDASATGQDLLIGRVRTADGFAPVITDLAVSPDGNLWGVSFDRLYQIDKATGIATEVGTLGVFGANALGFDANGALFGATIDGSFIRIDTRTGTASVLGSFGSGFVSWGDIAFAPDGRLFGTVRTIGGTGLLVLIDPTSGRATPVGPATGIGFDNVWGLTFVGNDLFGLTANLADGSGQLIRIDVSAGTGMFVRNLSFDAFGAGAASKAVGDF